MDDAKINIKVKIYLFYFLTKSLFKSARSVVLFFKLKVKLESEK